MTERQFVRTEVCGAVAIVTLDRPEARNAINDAMRTQFSAALAEVSSVDEVGVIVLTGAGVSFCAGGDVKAMRGRLGADPGRIAIDGWRRQRRTAEFVAALHESERITIAAVNGAAMGLGLDLALACDFIVAAPEASFGSSFVRRGLIPDGGGMYFLPRRIGLQRTKELIYSGRVVGADEAQRIGLVDRVASEGALIEDTLAYASLFTERSRPAIALMKSIVDRSLETPLDRIAALGGEAQAIAYTTDEHRTAVEAFLNR
ncbi:enoyl-CoA hydratase/isomerase family protein [Microbacterium sp. SYP-A9085]|uniref:enoyl-CoA hydratase/isomerase family protein n=1 Tax=Microbacterium sp. SYP-A9085 TaxID=2664454 RepID=UPI00129BDB8B|nr:enoyl-CoA hydratase/isomerase family protein [Microbacterium sp. SYP-A9085]MRH28758.1 enoyl-CoA hydratase/isomerase family protein [Microbacterium sp. SYP-A9085]